MASLAMTSVQAINKYSTDVHGGIIDCIDTPNKGRTLVARQNFVQGDVILLERPLHIVREDPGNSTWEALKRLSKKFDFDYDPLWYWAALRSLSAKELGSEPSWEPLSEELQARLLMLHQGEIQAPSKAAATIAKHFAPHLRRPIVLEKLLQAWVHNAFDFSDDPPGYATFFFPSFMSHSCFPSAFWHYGEDDCYVLRARRNITAGDEVTVSYLDESAMLDHAASRRWDLFETKQFWCGCERCDGGFDRSRGLCCPECHQGSIFGPAPGPSPATGDAGDLEAEPLAGEVCGWCNHVLTAKEAQILNNNEKTLKTILEGWEAGRGPNDSDAAETEEFLNACFTQHSLADRARETLAKFHGQRRQKDSQIRLLRQRTEFHAAAFPGLSAARGWSLEAYGDALVQGGDTKLFLAERAFSESLRVLCLMFGETHEYPQGVRAKLNNVKAQAQAQR